ncbi:MAG: sugar ABC transporter ATP-binding protein [Planctomycetota bacterium]|jgi:ribose transport system ATP-binding protein|nr:sugar ABC transporter ATP-binding protein [Planctomycetota bacterium]
MPDFLLVMKNIHKRFPGVHALRGVDFELRRGEVHAIIGENGAGKSTLIKILAGIYTADEGEIVIDGAKVDIDGVVSSKAQGISVIHQELVLAPSMTVAENIFLGRESMKGLFIDSRKMHGDAQRLLDSFNMDLDAEAIVKSLPIAKRQMVEIVKAISENSRILVMDEPTSSISDKEVDFLFATMRALAANGVGIIYISHKMSELEEICDRVSVLRDGAYVGTEVVREASKDKLISMMVGRELTNYYTRDFRPPGEVILRCEGISDGKMVKGASFELRAGEILGFAGLVGAGRSELMKCLFGLTKGFTGKLWIRGKEARISNPIQATAAGLALVPESRKDEAAYLVQSVRYNTTIEVLPEFIKFIFVNRDKEDEITSHYIRLMSTKTPSLEQKLIHLSGGNQQKVIIGRWLASHPGILILDEPTRGVDVGAKSEIYAIMNELVKEGIGIIMISSEMPEIINMSDRVYVMNQGRIAGCLERDVISQENIMRLAAR